MANQIFLRLDLPELNLFPVIKLGPNNILRVVWTVSEGVQVSKLLHEESKSHENQASDISYMSPLKKMLAILLYQLCVPNKKAFLQFMSRGPLNATFWHSLFRSFFTPGTPSLQLPIYFNYDDIWQIHLTRASFLCLINHKMSKKSGIEKTFFDL